MKKGKSCNLYGFLSYSPNLIKPALVIDKSFPSFKQTKILSVNVLMLEQKKIFHVKSKFQKELGLDIS